MEVNRHFLHWIERTAARLLEPLGNRWLHVQGVARRALWVGQLFDEEERLLLLAAAYVHDIGYAPELRQTGFHPLDSAVYARSLGKERLACLVAHHSEERFEAHLRGYTQQMQHFPRECSALADALIFCDMTTSPLGATISLHERIADILARYGEADLVAQAIRQALPSLTLAVEKTSQRLREHGLPRAESDDPQIDTECC
jgi:hypothetical protein